MLLIKLFLGPTAFFLETSLQGINTIHNKCSYLILFVTFKLNIRLNPLLLMCISDLYLYVNMLMQIGFVIHMLLFQPNSYLSLLTLFVLLLSGNKSHHIRKVFPAAYCTTSISRDIFISEILQAFFCHHQIYFLLLELNLTLHLLSRSLISHQDLHFPLKLHFF